MPLPSECRDGPVSLHLSLPPSQEPDRYSGSKLSIKAKMSISQPHPASRHGEGLVAGPGGRSVLDLSGQVLHPVLQVLLVGAHHLETLEHFTCGDGDGQFEGCA
ncbi:hypothetical protein EYF80_047136 [Liparis tanakae]|uniref:Uncharacterized protein n=1 Tax=Liparis tanakae TaxID=230148 RepID=A0A4Z2FQP1_9TELE|nr:hypothetical protein EYF80_047136 [Liparis tanakae]